MLTPAYVHFGRAHQVRDARQDILQEAYRLHSERFTKGTLVVQPLFRELWNNKPQTGTIECNHVAESPEEVLQ
ncbi:MAG: hypothetical protein IPK13_11470 [Deltaproteobacteria bacterium]|nr:hypothetical protein [Deltaproteobacteria bacterium]